MSGTTTTNNANKYDARIFTGKRSEYGMLVFSDRQRQAIYERHETSYKSVYELKEAYDKQEFLRKMRTDIKREYLTRKKQLKRLQIDAAVDFRNAEMSLQEHYASASASAQGQEPRIIHGVDISAPLVSQIQLPDGETLDLKTLQCHAEFDKLRGVHEDLRRDQLESIRIWEEEQQRQRECEVANEAYWGQGVSSDLATPPPPRQTRGAFGGCYDDDDVSESSCDSDYCGTFGDYPHEYNYEGETREAEEAQAQQQNKRPSHLPGCVNPKCVSCCWDNEVGYEVGYEKNAWSDDDENETEEEPDYDNKWNLPMTAEEKTILENGEEAQRLLEESPSSLCLCVADITISRAERMLELLRERAAIDEHKAMMEIQDCPPIHDEPASISTGGSAINKANKSKKSSSWSSSHAAKARIAKQQKKKHRKQKQYVPVQITDNTNRTNEVTAILTANKLEINVPKKNMQNAEAVKRHNKKWKGINSECKQTAARGTRITNIYKPRYEGDSDYSDWD